MYNSLSYYLETYQSDQSEEQLLEATLRDPEFDKWNYETFHMLLFNVCGLGGEKSHELSIDIAFQFMKWYKGWTGGWWERVKTYKDFPPINILQRQLNGALGVYHSHLTLPREELIMLLRQHENNFV